MADFRSGKPKFRLSLTANQALTAGAHTVAWDAADFDDVGGWSGGSNYVCDRPGLWIVGASANRAATGTGSTLTVRIYLNGANSQQVTMTTTTGSINAQVVDLAQLEAGDTIAMNVTLHGTQTATLNLGNTHLWGTRVGPKNWT